MCGLIFVAGNLDIRARDAFADMLIPTQVRGRDSTGVIAVRQDNSVHYMKELGTPENLLDTRRYHKEIDNFNNKLMIGHCRAKTVGPVARRTAHPFDTENLIGVHNGTLKNLHRKDGARDFEVDSEWLFNYMSENGAEDLFNGQLDTDDAYTLLWWDKEENVFRMIRNDKRPLWVTWSKDKKIMAGASEPWILGAFARKCGLWDGGESGNVYIEPPVNNIWTYDLNGNGAQPKDVFNLKEVVAVSPKEPPTYFSPAKNQQRKAQYMGTTARQLAQSKGGEVADPFQLDDPLPSELQEKAGAPPTSRGTSATASTTSSSSTDTKTGSTPGTASQKNTLSLVHNNSNCCPQDSKSGSLGACGASTRSSTALSKGVSFRRVAGLEYITDCRTGREYNFTGFELAMKSGLECCWCKEDIKDIKEVKEIFEGERFMCRNCL